MKENGINNTFKKIIFESSEMLFLADDTYPYNIFYSNESFENHIGQHLKEKTLVGLGLDINSYIFNEELIVSFQDRDFVFNLELPQENDSNYFLFYKGSELKTKGLPPKKDADAILGNCPDILGIGQENFMSWISPAVETVLGYHPEEVTNVELCQFFHPEDLDTAREVTAKAKAERSNQVFSSRILTKGGAFVWIEWHINFIGERFFLTGRNISKFKEEVARIAYKNDLYNFGEKSTLSGVWSINPQTNQLVVSEGFRNIFGWKETVTPTIEQVVQGISVEFRPLFQKMLTESLAMGSALDLKIKVNAGSGTGKWVQFAAETESSGGKVSRFFGSVKDVSIEQGFIHEFGLYKEMFEMSPEAILIADTSGKIIFTNHEANDRLMIVADESKETMFSDYEVRFKDLQQWEEFRRELEVDRNLRYKSSLRKTNGEFYEVEVSACLATTHGNTFIIAFARDISERVRLEKSLQESSDFLLHLTEQVPGALYQFVVNREGDMNFSYLSPGIKDLLGVSDTELKKFNNIGLAINKVHPEDIAQVLMTTVSSAKTLRPWQCQFRVKDLSGTGFKWVLGAAKPEQLETGEVIWYGYLADISEQKRFEENLSQAREQAERASQIKSEFLSMISHELRTPLNAISGSVYTLLQDEHSPNQASALNTINFAVDNLISMINDLLDYQKIEAGKLTLEYNPMNLKDVVQQVIKGLEFHAKDSRNKLLLQVSDEVNQEVKGDKVRLSQILNNLITNALKFTNNGTVEVKIHTVSQSEDRIKVYFEVKDTGIGIAKENQARIFNQFDQIQHSFSKKYGGTGLGLSITKRLLDQMKSQIQLESELGVGSRFFFEIEFEKTKRQFVPITPKVEVPALPLSQVKLLMAEDNDVNALVLGKIIKKWGIEYDRVNNGLEAVEAVSQRKYDCVLMDLQMPVMDGFEATEKITSMSKVPVIALSAAAKQDMMEKIERSGFVGYVSKPIDASELLKKIREVVG